MFATDYIDAHRRNERENTASGLILIEIVIVSLLAYFRFDSWEVGLLVFVALLILSRFRPVAIILSVVFSLFWALIGVVIGIGFFSHALLAVVFSVFAFVFSIILHLEFYRVI